MAFQDKSIQCSDCGATFTFSAQDQEFFQSKAIPMNPSAALPAVRLARRSAVAAPAAVVIQAVPARCSPLPAAVAAKPPRFLSSLAATNRSTAAIATAALSGKIVPTD